MAREQIEHIPNLLYMVADPALRTTDQDEEDPIPGQPSMHGER